MSTKNTKSIEKATEIIERFGGIRPMSNKTDIPVTTIQGWKKRNSIPSGRLDEILSAAKNHNVDLSDLTDQVSANQNEKPAAAKQQAKHVATSSPSTNKDEILLDKKAIPQMSNHDSIEGKLAEMESKAVTKSVLISSGIFAVIVLGAAALLWPKAEQANSQIEQNAQQIAAVEEEVKENIGITANVSDVIPDSWENQFNGLMEQANQIKEDAIAAKDQAQAALEKVQEVSNDVLGAEAGTIAERYEKLEGHLGDVVALPQMSGFMDQINSLGTSIPGQEALMGSGNELSALLSSFSGTPDQLGTYLDQARQQSDVLGQTFDGVASDDMKAAALLFTFNQMRAALNREGQPFDQDLALLKNFVGEDSTELHMAIDRLAPRAQDGVLTIEGLTNEFRDIAGEAVVASLQGEEVSVQEKAQARFNELFSVERDGELVTGTDTQAALAEINNLLEEGNLDEAITKASALEGPEAEVVQPWIEEAKNTKAAKEVKDILGYNIDLHTQSDQQEAIDMQAISTPGNMIYDPKSGLRIYLPSKSIKMP